MKEKYKKQLERPLTYFNGQVVKLTCAACRNKFDVSVGQRATIFCSGVCSDNFRSRISKLI